MIDSDSTVSKLHPDPLVTATLDKEFGSLGRRPATPLLPLRGGLIRLAVSIGLPLTWLFLATRNRLRPRRPAEAPENYVLFLPNLNQNLATMTAVCTRLRDTPVVFGCPHTVSRDRLAEGLASRHGGRRRILTLRWTEFVSFRQFTESMRFGRNLLNRYAGADAPLIRLVQSLCKYSLYGILCRDMRDAAFTGILSRPPAAIVSARPKSHYANLPFLHAARDAGIPAYYLAHTHIDASPHFQYQVFRPGLFRAFFLFSVICQRVAEQNFTVDGEIVVTGDPSLDGADLAIPEVGGAASGPFRIMYAASEFYGQDSMCDLAEVTGSMANVSLFIKTRPPGNNSREIVRLLRGRAGITILDHADTGPIEAILDRADVIVGCATNVAINAVLRGVPALVYINDLDQGKIERRGMQPLPYEDFGVPVVTTKVELRDTLRKLADNEYRRAFLRRQRDTAWRMYPNLSGPPAADVIGAYLRSHSG